MRTGTRCGTSATSYVELIHESGSRSEWCGGVRSAVREAKTRPGVVQVRVDGKIRWERGSAR